MLTKSQNYATIWADDSHYAETKIVVNGTSYGETSIMSCERTQNLFGDYLGIGGTVINQISFSLIGVAPALIPRMSRVEVWTRLWNGDGSDSTDWLPMGAYYTDKPDYDPESGICQVIGYDEMFRTSPIPYNEGSVVTSWDNPTLRQVAEHLVEGTTVANVIDTNFAGIGLTLEDSTQVLNTITMPSIPYNYTVREILGDIATACCGNWYIVWVDNGDDTQTAKLRLITMGSIYYSVSSQALGRDVTAFNRGDMVLPVITAKVFYGYDSNGASLYAESSAAQQGKNLFNINANYIESGAIASASGSDTTSSTRIRNNGYIEVEPSTTYTISTNLPRVFMLEYETTDNYLYLSSGWQGQPYTFTTSSDTHYVRFVFANSSNTSISPSDLEWVQLELGSQATPYEPYIDPLSTGRIYEVETRCITDGTEAKKIADAIINGMGWDYYPYSASGANLDPACELGDKVSVNGISGVLATVSTKFNRGMWANIEAPGIEEVNDAPWLFSSVTESNRIEKEAQVNSARITVNTDAITAEVTRATDAESDLNTNLRTTITQTATDLTATITEVQGNLDEHASEQSTYIRYSAAGLELGKSTDMSKAILTPTKLSFQNSLGDEKAYIGQDTNDNDIYKFFVVNGHIVNQLELGDHWLLVASGADNDYRLTFKWKA